MHFKDLEPDAEISDEDFEPEIPSGRIRRKSIREAAIEGDPPR